MFELKGIYAPIATPFTDGEIDYEKLAANLDRWCASGMEGLVLLGSNGEFVSLTESEKRNSSSARAITCTIRSRMMQKPESWTRPASMRSNSCRSTRRSQPGTESAASSTPWIKSACTEANRDCRSAARTPLPRQ